MFFLGDFDEEFHRIARAGSRRSARAWYWRQTLRSFPANIKDIVYWRMVMLKNYLKIAIRQIRKYKGYAFINIAGLAIGVAVCMLIMLWVVDELRFDAFHEKADRIYRVCLDAYAGSSLRAPVTMAPAGPAMVEEYPEVEDAVRITSPGRVTVQVVDRIFQEDDVNFADASFLEVFTFPLLVGDPKTALASPYTVVITQEMVDKYFGDEDPMGKVLKIGDATEYRVTGVLDNFPRNSSLSLHMIRSFETLIARNTPGLNQWLSVSYGTFLLLAPGADAKALEAKFPNLIEENLGPTLRAIGGRVDLFLQPLLRIHLHSDFQRDFSSNGNISYVYLFSGIAMFVLLIACVNFINLATARSSMRAREVGMRKTLGALRNRLVQQFIGESLLYAFLAILLALLLDLLVLPFFSNIVGRRIGFGLVPLPVLILSLTVLASFIGLLAGCYPAFYLSGFRPVAVLKGSLRAGAANSRFRSILVVFQFAISVTIIVGTLTVYNQLTFLRNKNLGFDKEHILIVPNIGDDMTRLYPTLREGLLSIPGVENVGGSNFILSRSMRKSIFQPEGFSADELQTLEVMSIDEHYFETMGMTLSEGRNFSMRFSTDTSQSVIINETAARTFGWENPVGKRFIFAPPPNTEGETTYGYVVGTVKDFHTQSLHNPIEPMIIFFDPTGIDDIMVRLTPGNIPHTLDLLEAKWREFNPNKPFDTFFQDESFDRLYRTEEQLGKITLAFSVLAVFIGCLGLFGLAAFMAERRTKEIGIRKTLGASTTTVMGLMSKEFILLVAVANFLAWPAAYFALNRWMQNFTYRADIAWWTFALAGIGTILIALFTVSYQSLRAARSNPVDALRYE